MTKFNSSTATFGFDMLDLVEHFIAAGSYSANSAGGYTYQASALWNDLHPVLTVTGSGLTYDASGMPTGGAVTGMTFTLTGAAGTTPIKMMTVSGFSAPAAGLLSSMDALYVLVGGNDRFDGSAFADVLYGFNGNDTLVGAAGNDTLLGGNGSDALYGGIGIDTVSFADLTIQSTLHGIYGVDADLTSGIATHNIYQPSLSGRVGDTLISVETDTLSSIENAIGSAGADKLYGTAIGNTLQGGASSDLLDGRAGNDRLYGDDGTDWLHGGDGADLLNGGFGDDYFFEDNAGGPYSNDTMVGGDGNDRVEYGYRTSAITFDYAAGKVTFAGSTEVDRISSIDSAVTGSGDDLLKGSALSNNFWSGDGNDTIYGYGGADIIYAGAGNNLVYGGDGNDIIGNSGTTLEGVLIVSNDTLDGGNGDDQITSGYGTDVVLAGAGNDTIWHNLGQSTIDAGTGNDNVYAGNGSLVVTLGAGADTFHASPYSYGSPSINFPGVNYDYFAEIRDFHSGEDKIDLTDLGLLAADRGNTWDMTQWSNGVGIEFTTLTATGFVTSSILLNGLTLDQIKTTDLII